MGTRGEKERRIDEEERGANERNETNGRRKKRQKNTQPASALYTTRVRSALCACFQSRIPGHRTPLENGQVAFIEQKVKKLQKTIVQDGG